MVKTASMATGALVVSKRWQEESLENSKGSDAKDVNRARELRDEAVAKARAYAAAGDPVVFIGGLDHEHDLEGRDRTDMRLP